MSVKNYTKYRGDTTSFLLTFRNASNVAIDITGYTVFFTLKAALSDADGSAKISKTITSHTNPTGGITTITLSNSDTDALSGTYYYDIQYKTPSGAIKTIQSGTIIFVYDVTRRTT